MSAVSDVGLQVAQNLFTVVQPALLVVLGAFVTFVAAVYGVVHVLALINGKPSSSVAYDMGRIFGSMVYESDYRDYRDKRDASAARRERNAKFSRRYRSEKY